jgi:methylenetetrahydrofolate reductase (NADPH)
MGVEPVMQMVCRDRNRIAIQSDVLGAVALGIGNILCLSGDYQSFGDHPTAKGVFDLDSIQLIQLLKQMRDEKTFLSGEKISGEVPLFIGAAENPFGDPFEYRALRLAMKVKAGVDFIQTQAVFDVDKFGKWMQMVTDRGLDKETHILAGMIPIKTVGMARYMRDNVPGVIVPDEIVTRMQDAKDVREEGIKIALEIIDQIKDIPGIHGVHIMAVGWEDIVPTIVERAGLLPRPLT